MLYTRLTNILLILLLFLPSGMLEQQQYNVAALDENTGPGRLNTHRIILKTAGDGVGDANTDAWQAIQADLKSTQQSLRHLRYMSGGARVAQITTRASKSQLAKTLRRWQQRRWVEYAEFDSHVTPSAVPDDFLYSLQWQLRSYTENLAAMNVSEAWDITQGSSETVIAVIDTGVRFDHSDLTGRLLPGYDFVSGINQFRQRARVPTELNFLKAHDGDGRDSDATDPGDGVDAEIAAQMEEQDLDCPMQESSWHGTAIASLIAANGNDGVGMAGVDWAASILPVRAIGRCGGRRSDLLDAIRWAAGVEDPALPPNPTPARLINLSLGIDDACTASDQHAINDAVNSGALVVAAVGNLSRNLDEQPSSPAHCNNVLGVTAVDSLGLRASYSSFGADADFAAPGGEGPNGDNRPILIATNDGYIEPEPASSHRFTTGTSIAAPLVTGVISLMLSVSPDLSNAEISALLKSTARRFPNELDLIEEPERLFSDNVPCTAQTCGAGLIDAASAVEAAANFNSADPGDLAAAIAEDQPVFRVSSKGGSAAGSPLSILLLAVVLFRRKAPPKPKKP